MKLPAIYPITDRAVSGLEHSEQVRLLVAAGARLIQLREKALGEAEFLEDARRAAEFAKAAEATLIVNDRIDLAARLGTGVHLGQGDASPFEARRILGPGAVIGFSTHNIEEALKAIGLPVDYIAIGPVFPTSTKADTEPVVGSAGVAAVRARIGDFPLVAIGGINSANIREVLGAGADSAAVISAALAPPGTIRENFRELVRLAARP